MIQKISLIANAVLLIAVIIFSVLFFNGCNTFKVINIEGELPECNRYYTTLSFYSSIEKGKSDAFIGTVYTDCSNAAKAKQAAKKDADCIIKWFGKDGIIDKSKYEKYTGYLECLK